MASILMCDKCGKVFKEENRSVTVSINFVSNRSSYFVEDDVFGVRVREYDVCSDCARDVVDMFNETKAITVESGIRL